MNNEPVHHYAPLLLSGRLPYKGICGGWLEWGQYRYVITLNIALHHTVPDSLNTEVANTHTLHTIAM